jgi:hypothetical protein
MRLSPLNLTNLPAVRVVPGPPDRTIGGVYSPAILGVRVIAYPSTLLVFTPVEIEEIRMIGAEALKK